ncbi:MAG: O-methyltransferase [Opitutaceae bacterium]|nr:O-methyltransferase [Opitutaceae bacterium]MBP9913974.1 O-methyltransferase [Opitutaceae bacterium]
MSLDQWTAVDSYFNDLLIPSDPVLEAVLANSQAAGLPAFNVAPNQGKLLQLLARTHGAKRILEIGTLGGYSTIWLARALPLGGRLITLEKNPDYAKVALANFARAGLSDTIELRLGAAIETLPQLAAENAGPFDLVFIDADKVSTPDYFIWALKLSRAGTLVMVDNVVRNGAVIDEASTDPSVQGVRRFLELIAAEPRVNAMALQTVGSKGYDGFVLLTVNPSPVE